MLPILFKTSFFTLYSYPFLMGISWMVGFRITKILLQKYDQPFSVSSSNYETEFSLKFIGLIIFSFVGAKLAFLFFSAGHLLDQYSSSLSFWLGGGFVFYGGMLGAGLWTFFFIPKRWHRFFVPSAAIAHGIGRIGCFLAGCCYGHDHFPIQLVESAGLFILGFWCLKNIKRHNLVIIYLIAYSSFRFILEFFRADEIRGQWLSLLSSSQIISIVIFIIASLFLWKRNVFNRNIEL